MSTTRKETLERKNALLRDLRLAHHHSVALPGDIALSQRELSAKYGLSMRTISIELQKLVDEGVLYTIPRVGTFVGRPHAARNNLFLVIFRYLDEPNSQWATVRAGFEERIASLGGTSVVLDYETARHYRTAGEIVAPAGIFELHDKGQDAIWLEPGMPHVEFGELGNVHAGSDAVYFNNSDGGLKATRHLLALGHTKIAFLGLHPAQGDPGFFLWSQEREAGWRRAMIEAGHSTEGLVVLPEHTPDFEVEALVSLSFDIANRLLEQDNFTAVVAVNAHTAQGLFQALRTSHRSTDLWPAIVGFDTEIADSTGDAMHIVTTLRLPWEELGREAANLLWERAHGRLTDFEQRLVPMTLIPRLSCRQEWHRAPGVTAQHKQWVPAVP